MSANPIVKPPSKPLSKPQSTAVRPTQPDPRIRRTRDILGDALAELIGEMPFDDITVQGVLDRAGVGRTTFYTHFRDKQDLFLSDVEDFLAGMSNLLTRRGAPPRRVAPVEELFAHLAEVRDFHQALVASGKFADVRDLGLGYFARSIEQRLTLAGVKLPPTDLRATSHALSGALFALLEWWIAHPQAASPAEMDALFHRQVWQGIDLPNPG